MDKKTLEAFTEELRNQLVKRNEIVLNNLGTFGTRHRKQNQKVDKNGRVSLEPPADEIIFTANKQES